MKLYFMGICGTAMGNAALLARSAGHEVVGSDAGVYPPMSTVLQEAGIAVHEGYDPGRLQKIAPDLVVIGNALSRGHPEIEWLWESRAFACVSLPGFLADHVLKGRKNIVIAGTHGKTTTTAMTAFLLRENECDPGFLIGGVPNDPPVGNHLGTPDDPFVIEGDEYDSAFFDKRSKFIHYAPSIAVINNLEFDHADIFRDLADVQRTFRHLTRIVPRNGWIVLNGDDANLKTLVPMPWTRVLKVGVDAGNDVRISNFNEDADGATFTLLWRNNVWAKIKWSQPGLFNARNAAMAAIAAQLSLLPLDRNNEESVTHFVTNASAPESLKLEGLSRFRGVKRRQEILLNTKGLKVIEDFGHHPTALAETLQSFRARFPDHVIHAAFEPRSNTARTRVMQTGFMRALALADEVYIGNVSRAEGLADAERFDVEGVLSFLDSQGTHGQSAENNMILLEKLIINTLSLFDTPQLVVFFTNGSFDGIIGKYVAAARKAALVQS
jgi:UDP-N-acetylmuramate: L-alanyl-gamma-D-glutamyl-meso-diaminopimelate ligase